MADGSIKIAIEVDGKQVTIVSDELEKLEKAGKDSGKGVKETEDSLKGVNKESSKATGNVKRFATALGLVALGAMAFRTLKNSMDAAISRFDTLNKFPKVLQALGVSAEDSERAMGRLSDGIDGLPTKLDEISATAQRMYTSFNDIDKATDSALALNNALLGSGSSAADAQRGTEQYIKFLQTGKMEMDTWNTLQETMDIGLIKIAESFNYTGKTAKQDLYNALKDGHVTMDQFNNKLIEVGTGTGILAELAKENSLGIATSLGNLRNAAARGMADIVTRFNKLSKELTGKDIAQNIDGLKVIVNRSFKSIGNFIDRTTPYVKAFVNAVKDAIPVVMALSPILIGLASAYTLNLVVHKVTTAIKANATMVAIATTAKNAYAIATNRLALTMTLALVQQKLMTAALIAYNGVVKLAVTVQALLTSGISLASIATIGLSGAIKILSAAIKLLMGPVGWVTAGVGALVGVAIAVVKWFNKSSAEAKRLNKETEELAESTDELNSAVEQSAKTYEKNQSEIKASAKANEELAKRIDDLAKRENKSAAEKALLNSYIEELNENVQDLNLSYNQEADALSMSSEQLQARIDLMREQEKAQEAQNRLTEILKEQAEVEAQLEESNALREEWNRKLEESSVTSKEHKEALEKLAEQENVLRETNIELAEQQKVTEEQITQSMEAIATATEESVNSQILSFEELSESQQSTIENLKATWEDYKAAATDMFDTLSDKSELSVKEMQENLEENQRIIGEWAENIATLAERGVDQGLLDTLREAGPESAGHVKALVDASDEELAKLSETFSEGGKTATEALSKSLGIEETGVMDAVSHLVVDTEQSLRQQINNADFTGIGKDVADGLAGGIYEGTSYAEQASRTMADKTILATKKELSIHSPSKVFKDIGTDVTDGMSLGINDGTTKVIQAMTKLAKNTISQFNGINDQFYSIGTNVMTGLNQGLLAGKANVLSTARSIANSVASTMQSALKIQSPSRVMMNLGRWIPEGLALGIEKYSGLVDKATARMIQYTTPEMALGTNKMNYASSVGRVVAGNSSTTNSKSYNPIINNYFTRDESTPSEVARKNKQQQQRLAMEWGYS